MPRLIHPPESIYNLIPKVEVKPEKPPRYTSKFSEQVKQEKQQNKVPRKTMGPAKVETPSPEK
ncbi:enkurin-like, partial [Tachysurus ichikawai]